MGFSAPCGAGARVHTRASVSNVRVRYVEKKIRTRYVSKNEIRATRLDLVH